MIDILHDRRLVEARLSIRSIRARFRTANGDGVGDLRGHHRAAATICIELGVDAIWISPIFPSPMADFGYDVSDYTRHRSAVRHAGRLRRAGRRRARARAEARSSTSCRTTPRTSIRGSARAARRATMPKRDWYIWRDPAPDGGPPNNWLSRLRRLAPGQFDEATGQYYYHAFLKEQPDLNWRNPEVRAAMHDVLRFWLERGVDGFRVDVDLAPDRRTTSFRDNPPNPGLSAGRAADIEQPAAALFDRPAGGARRHRGHARGARRVSRTAC